MSAINFKILAKRRRPAGNICPALPIHRVFGRFPHCQAQALANLLAQNSGIDEQCRAQWPLAAEAASSSAAAWGLCAAMTFSASSAGTKS